MFCYFVATSMDQQADGSPKQTVHIAV